MTGALKWRRMRLDGTKTMTDRVCGWLMSELDPALGLTMDSRQLPLETLLLWLLFRRSPNTGVAGGLDD